MPHNYAVSVQSIMGATANRCTREPASARDFTRFHARTDPHGYPAILAKTDARDP